MLFFIWASFDGFTSATEMATGSVSLRVMVSGDAVMPGRKNIWMTLIKSHSVNSDSVKPAGEDAANQAAIKMLSSAERNPATQHFLAPQCGISLDQLGGCCWSQSALTCSVSLLCAALYFCLELHNVSSDYFRDLLVHITAYKLPYCTLMDTSVFLQSCTADV